MKEKLSCSGKWLVKKVIKKFGYIKQRQKGSHVTLEFEGKGLTIPLHKELDKGTQNAIIRLVSLHTGLKKEEIIKKLKS